LTLPFHDMAHLPLANGVSKSPIALRLIGCISPNEAEGGVWGEGAEDAEVEGEGNYTLTPTLSQWERE